MYENAKLVYYPDPILRKPCAPVEQVDDTIRDLVKRMFEVMYEHRGVGLAAPQVGVSLRVYIVNTTGEKSGEQVLINPAVVETSGNQSDSEGCLSFPGVSIKVARPRTARISAQDLSGRRRELEGVGLAARAYLHELDHLNGVLIVDKMTSLQKLSWRRTLRQLEDDLQSGRPRPPTPEE